ncbi:MAG TPA: 2-phosphosulfolactate phosphatase [Planctomycetota bacterium]|nr:2-phosphosulfolactate phosphatase [Planctomycetota bacterium]
MTFDQAGARARCEWGPQGLRALAPADVVIVVDVLSFSTCAEIAAGRGAEILPFPWKDGRGSAFAAAEGAVLARPRGSGRYSLSPASFLDAPFGLRCVLPSPNGAALALAARDLRSVVLAGSLRNAAAVADAARRLGTSWNVCPAGERWPDGSLRPALEDWIAAGAILRGLPGPRSPEAEAAVVSFEASRTRLPETLAATGSGRELIARGFPGDVDLAAALDAGGHVPRLAGTAFVAAA